MSLVITERELEALQKKLEDIEESSGKRKLKWNKTKFDSRIAYLDLILKELKGEKVLRYSIFKETSDYDLATILAISKAMHFQEPKQYKTLIYIDALAKMKKRWYGTELWKLGVSTYKIQGVTRDENNPMIRLADTIAGWVRDSLEGGGSRYRDLFNRASQNKTLIEI